MPHSANAATWAQMGFGLVRVVVHKIWEGGCSRDIMQLPFKTRKPCYCRGTVRCRSKFWYVSNFTTASYRTCSTFPCHSTAFFLIFIRKLQCIIWQKVISTRKNQPDCIFIAVHQSQLLPSWSSLFTANVMVVINRTSKDRCAKAYYCYLPTSLLLLCTHAGCRLGESAA